MRQLLGTTLLLIAVAGLAATQTAAVAPDAAASKRVVSRQVIDGAARIYVGSSRAVPAKVVEKTLADGSRVSSVSSTAADSRVTARSMSGMPTSALTQADLERWVNDHDPADEGMGPVHAADAGASTSGSSGGSVARTACCKTPAPVCSSMDRSGDHPDEHTVHVRTCTSYHNAYRAHGNHYFTTKNIGSAWADDQTCSFNCDVILGGAAKSWYSIGRVVAWAPRGDVVMDTCTDVTTTASFGAATSSQTRQVCPDSLRLWGLGERSSGSKWDGKCDDCARGFHSTQVVEWPNRQSMTFHVTSTLWWN